MTAGATSNDPADWLETAVRHHFMSADRSAELREALQQGGATPAELAVQRGVLSAVQCDIVEALANPTSVAPGYEIEDMLGQGGIGVVYRARQVNLDRPVALKTVMLHRLDQPETLPRFRREAKAIGTFRHPNVVTAYDFGMHEGRLYLAMELVEGQDISAWLARHGRMSEQLALAVARQIAAGLAHAAQQKIVHRDIKPGNVLLTDAPEGYPLPPGVPLAKITDFGLALLSAATADDRLTADGSTMGTPQYMAPEQFLGSTVDHRADIFSLGATLYEMLSGTKPFSGGSMAEVFANRLKGGRRSLDQFVPNLSPDCVRLVENLMAEDRESRPQDYESIVRLIDGILQSTASSHDAPWQSSRFEGSQPHTPADAQAETLPHLSQHTPTPAGLPPTEQAASTQQAVPADRPPSKRKRATRTSLLIALGTATLAMGIAAAVALRDRTDAPPNDNLVETGRAWPLYGGDSIDEWQVLGGSWSQNVDAEGGNVMTGRSTPSQAAIHTRTLPLPVDSPLKSFRIRLGIDPLDASAVEIRFGAVAASDGPSNGGVSLSLRLVGDEAILGRVGEARDFEPFSSPNALPAQDKNAPQYFRIQLDYHNQLWRVKVDEAFIGTARAAAGLRQDRLMLIVIDGMADFESIWLAELETSNSNRTEKNKR